MDKLSRTLLAMIFTFSMFVLPPHALRASDPGTLPAGVTVLGSSAFASNDGNYLNIVGLVGNGTDRTRIAVRVVAYLYNAAGSRVGYRYGYTFHQKVAPGMKSPFTMLVRMPKDYDHYSLRVTSFPSSSEPSPDLQVSGVTAFYGSAEEGSEKEPPYLVVGEVLNNTDVAVRALKIAAIFYDDAGHVINVQTSSLPRQELAAGEKEPFKLRVTSGPVSENVDVVAACRKATTVRQSSLYTTGVRLEPRQEGKLMLSGTVVNGGNSRVTFVQIIGAIYGEHGEVLDAGYTYTYPLHLEPRASTTFGIIFDEHSKGTTGYFVYPSER